MFAVDWTAIGFAGTFVVGALAGVIVTIRLSKVLIEWLREDDHEHRGGPSKS